MLDAENLGSYRPTNDQRKKKSQVPQYHAQVVAAAAQQSVEGIAFHAFEAVSPQPAVVLHVADHRLDGAAAPDVALEFMVVDIRATFHVCAAIAQIQMTGAR